MYWGLFWGLIRGYTLNEIGIPYMGVSINEGFLSLLFWQPLIKTNTLKHRTLCPSLIWPFSSENRL